MVRVWAAVRVGFGRIAVVAIGFSPWETTANAGILPPSTSQGQDDDFVV
jgi:hypothetical protein